MGDRYRVTVERLTPAADGVGDDYATIVELLAEAEMLARFAPQAVAEALGAEQGTLATGGVVPATGEPVFQDATVPRQTRRRRTKAEIEADKLAEHQAASAAPVPGGPVPGPSPAEVVAPMNQTPALDAPPAEPFNPFNR